MADKLITVTVEGGVIQAIDGIPDGITIKVMDYDVDGCDITADDIHKDKNGDYYILGIWRND